MDHLDAAVLLDTSVVEVLHVGSSWPWSAAGDEEWNQVPQIVLPRRGLFIVHRRGERVLADPTRAIVFGPEEGYRVSHPLDTGDECVVLQFRADIHEGAIGWLHGCSGSLSPRTQLSTRLFVGAVRRDDADALACEEAAVLLEAVASDLTDASRAGARVSKTERDRVDHVRALLADDLTRRWRLDAVGQAVHCSPFHLARQFRATTGETISRYLLRLRLAAALQRISEGESDLARLAVELGFSHHSHFTAWLRSVFGCTPVRARGALTTSRIRELRTMLTADCDSSASVMTMIDSQNRRALPSAIQRLSATGAFASDAHELMLYGRLIGAWGIDWVSFDGSGKAVERRRGEWHFAWVLGGRGVQDVIWTVGAPPEDDGTTLLAGTHSSARGGWCSCRG